MLYGLSGAVAAPHRQHGLRGRQKNTANTNIIMWQGRLFALMEAAQADRDRSA